MFNGDIGSSDIYYFFCLVIVLFKRFSNLGCVVSKDHVHMHIEYAPKLSISNIVKRLKGRTSRKLQQEYPKLKEKYWGRHFWQIGYGGWSTGNVTDEMIQEYLEHHRKPSNSDTNSMILE